MPDQGSQPRFARALLLLWCVGGILGSLVVYGVLQERIMQQPFGDERFTFSLLLVLLNRLVTCSVGFGTLAARKEPMGPAAPLSSYAAVSASNVVATYCQYEALKHVSFAVATLGKTAKMLPVMVWGAVMTGRRYKVRDVALAVAVTGGCTMFLLLGPSAAPSAVQGRAEGSDTSEGSRRLAEAAAAAGGEAAAATAGAASSLLSSSSSLATAKGLLFLAGYLAADGFTSTFQDKLFRGYDMSIFNQVAWVTTISAGFSFSWLLTSGQLVPGISFLRRHPDALRAALCLCLAATASQVFISKTIKTFGALTFATTMTTRQFVSILLSAAIFGHAMTAGQVSSAFVVFGALYFKVLSAKKVPRRGTASTGPAQGHVDPRAEAELTAIAVPSSAAPAAAAAAASRKEPHDPSEAVPLSRTAV